MTFSPLFGICRLAIFLACLRLPLLSQSSPDVQGKTGDIQGKISISNPEAISEDLFHARSMTRYHAGTTDLTKLPEPYKLSEKAVVYIESVKESETSVPPADHPQLVQRDLLFRPLVLPVLVGTTVDFPNQDELFHNVFSYSQPREFDLGRYPKGQSRSVTFEKVGVVNVFCDIHSYMYATILVLPNPYFAIPDDNGNYRISKLPQGTYRLTFWYGRKKIETKTITVTAGETTAANFSY